MKGHLTKKIMIGRSNVNELFIFDICILKCFLKKSID